MQWKPGLAATAIASGRQLRAAIYNRVSKDPTGQQRSVGEQDQENRDACNELGYLLGPGAVYVDNDRSASIYATKDRPDWNRLLADLEARRYDVVVLWEVSRGDRDDLGWLTFLRAMQNLGVLIHITCHGRTFDPRDDFDYQVLANEGSDSAAESRKTSRRIKRNTEANALKGRPHGVVPYGYRREYEVDRHGRRAIVAQVADDQQHEARAGDGSVSIYSHAGIVREIVKRLRSGDTNRAIAADLNWRGIPAPRRSVKGWTDSTVRAIALNPTYAGFRHRHGLVVAEAIWPPLIDQADHHALVGKFADPSRRTQRDSTIKHLGSGLYVCAVCQHPVRTVKRRYGGEIDRAYSCWPTRMKARKAVQQPREVTEAELAELKVLPLREQTARALELFESGVTQTSIARGLGLLPVTLNYRIGVERRRRPAGGSGPGTERKPTSFHVSRRVGDVDDYVQRAVWLRMSRPHIADLLVEEDDRAEAETEALNAEIAEKQRRLDEARDAYSAGRGLSLEALIRIEKTLEPEIGQARSRLNRSRVRPVLEGLLLPDVAKVEAAWWLRSLPQRREVIRALVERVEILPLPKDRKTYTIEESVRIVWRAPRR